MKTAKQDFNVIEKEKNKPSKLLKFLEDKPRASKVFQKYVITTEVKSPGGGALEEYDTSASWQFRTLFVMEATVVNISVIFCLIFFWVLNRQVHMRPTRGSQITHKRSSEDDLTDGDTSDDDDDDNNNKNHDGSDGERFNRRKHRRSMMERLVSYGIENDDDDLLIDPSTDNTTGNNNSDTKFESLPWGRQLQDLLHIETLWFLNEQALTICAKSSEYVTYKKGEKIFDVNDFDGTLYAVVSSGSDVEVTFYDFEMPEELIPIMTNDVNSESASSSSSNTNKGRPFTIKVGEGTVVTSFLALFWGMLHQYHADNGGDNNKMPKYPFRVSARSMADDTELIRIQPDCFARILKEFPVDVFRIIGTVLNRLQRITVQTLVKRLGLRKDLLPKPKQIPAYQMELSNSYDWKQFHHEFSKDDFCDETDLTERAIALFRSRLGIPLEMDAESKTLLRDYAELVVLDGAQTLIEAGTKHDACYLLLKGNMASGIYIPNGPQDWSFHVQQVVTPGGLLGEHECFTGEVSLTAVRCCSDEANCVLLKVPRHVYKTLIVRYPKAMARALDSLLDQVSPAVFLLNWTSNWLHVKAAGAVTERGTKCDALYVVLNGRLRARRSSDTRSPNNQRHPEEYGRGKVVGEIGILTGAKWPFDVYAIRHSEIAKVPVETLLVIIRAFPKAGLNFARSIATHVQTVHYDRLPKLTTKHTDQSFIPRSIESRQRGLPSYGLRLSTIAVVPMDSAGIDLDKFCSTLVSGFRKIAPSTLLTKDTIRAKLGENAYRSHNFAMHEFRMVRMMADIEENNRLVIYQADPKYTWWTRLCIQQADCILLLVNSDRAPEGKRVEQSLTWAYESMDVQIDLVVVGKNQQMFQFDDDEEDDEYGDKDEEKMTVSDQLNNWSEQRKWISGHHLVRAPVGRHKVDFDRLCRRVTGRAVGLVLGAGGARGLAHLGVVRALEEAGVTVDVVGGTSQGAFVGALYAKQPDDLDAVFSECRKMAIEMSSLTSKLFDLTLPMTSLFSGQMFNRGIRKRLGTLRMQDLVLKFFCNSVDLQKQKGVIHTKGLLWKYVRASMSLTGYLPPIAENGQLLVDGGYMNALPADIMRYEMGARVVIGVDTNGEIERDYDMWGNYLSGWWVLWNSMNPFSKTVKVPSMGDLSDLLIWVSSDKHRRDNKRICDLYLKPPVAHIGTLEYDKIDEIIEKSYNHAKPIIDDWVKKNPWLVQDNSKVSQVAEGS